ncbi:AMP-binding protein [uncultured Polaribacter sp.]|uniref:AMP-binding protein n=1 Tax=uncultured Polaribacter sp. TaxID=174711 RepID=UPI002604B96D|nr:AMP-binding protein [uncultured Polaribacter sp.]
MAPHKFHKNFTLNSFSFTCVDELLSYSKNLATENQEFLKAWFAPEPFLIVQTSGSTGKPKPIKILKQQMINSALATGEFFNLKPKTTALLCLPTKYIAGKMMLVRALTLGWHLDIINANTKPLKNNNKIYDFSAMVPLQVENSLEKLNAIKQLIVGGGLVSCQLQKKLQNCSTKVFATYGMTETITHIAVKQLNNFNTIYKTAFYKTLPNTTIYVDERSCLVIKNEKVTNTVIFTNDVVQLTSNNQFEWLGRYDNVINSGGIKLQPEKIEEKLSEIIQHRFFVAGIKDAILGEKLILIIESAVANLPKNIKDKISAANILSKFEIPKAIYFINTFIETETGKIQRKATLEQIKTNSTS